VLNECLGLQNKPQAEVLPGHKLTGPKKKKKKKKKAPMICAKLLHGVHSNILT
jgi:hypothetical protein